MLLKPCMAAGVDGMSYSDITAMLTSSAVPEPHHLDTAQETPAPLPTPDDNSPVAHHPHGAHAQSSSSHEDMRSSSHSLSVGNSSVADTSVSVVPASATHSSSSSSGGSKSQADISLLEADTDSSLQEADTDASLQEADTDVSLQEADTDASLQEAATDVSLQEADTDASLQEGDTDASLQEADIDAEMTCMPGQQEPAAMAETIDLQSTTGASGQHNACQIPPDVHSSSRHPSQADVHSGSRQPSQADAHEVLQVLAGVQSSDDLSMQQLHILAGMDAQSSDGTTTLCDSPIGSVSSLGVDDRLSRFGQAAAMPRPGGGQIDGSTELGLTDLSMEATVSRLHAEETESLPEHQRAGSADSTATPVEEEWLMQQTSYEVSYQTLLSVCKSGCSS